MKKLSVNPFVVLCVSACISVLVLAGCRKEQKAAQIHVGVLQAQTGMLAAFGQGGVFE